MNQNPSERSDGLVSRIRQSISPSPLIPLTQTERKRFIFQHLIFHLRPATLPASTLRFSLSLGLGGLAALLVLLQITTGVLLKFVYVPTPVGAYESVQYIISEIRFGRLIRNLHHWCAHLLVLIAFFHMLRVFFTGAFHPPRQFNWIIGLAMFCTVLFANFTGYLLPWDQLAYWAITVSTGMLEYVPLIGTSINEMIHGGVDIGPVTLSAFFATHTSVIPFLILILMAFHFWRIRKAGGLVFPRQSGNEPDERPVRVPSIPHLFLRELVVALVLVAAVLVFSVFNDAPLAEPANPGLSPNPAKAPWYFAGLQELLLHLHPVIAVSVIPLVVGIALVAIPYIRYDSDVSGIWFVSQRGRRLGIIAATIALIITPVLLVADEWIAAKDKQPAFISSVISNGLIPILLLLAVLVLFSWAIKRFFSATTSESVQTLFVLLSVAFGVLTFVGICFRGPGMALTIPF